LTKGVLAERPGQKNNLPLFRTLKSGLGYLVENLAAAIAGKGEVIHRRAEAVERAERGFRIRLNGDWLETRHLVLACEAHQAALLAKGVDAALSELLAAIPYSSSMTLALGFEQSAFKKPLDGFGFLIPRRERRRLVAGTWVGTKFPHRVPEGLVLLRCFLGGTENAGVLAESDDSVVAHAIEELRGIVGLQASPLFSRVYRWPHSMAQNTVGHPRRLAEIERRVAEIPGLHLAGNAYYGIGIPDCVRSGKQAAERISGLR